MWVQMTAAKIEVSSGFYGNRWTLLSEIGSTSTNALLKDGIWSEPRSLVGAWKMKWRRRMEKIIWEHMGQLGIVHCLLWLDFSRHVENVAFLWKPKKLLTDWMQGCDRKRFVFLHKSLQKQRKKELEEEAFKRPFHNLDDK